MDMSPFQPAESFLLFHCEAVLGEPVASDPSSDPGYVSASSGLSPTSSVDSFCFSPASIQPSGGKQEASDQRFLSRPVKPSLTYEMHTLSCSSSFSASPPPAKKCRSRCPSKKRKTASEREKLRMRDLTKALNHLRTYLPPSVAPPGQTLTKIETLRLTIQYISDLSEQLGHSEELLQRRTPSGPAEEIQSLTQFLDQPTACCGHQANSQLCSLHQPYQVSRGDCFNSQEFWMLPD